MKLERIAALGALGVCGGIIATYLFLVWLSMPTAMAAAPGATGGINASTRDVIAISALVPVLLFVSSHLAAAKQLRGGPTSLND